MKMGTERARLLLETDTHQTTRSSWPDGKKGCRSEVDVLYGFESLRQRRGRGSRGRSANVPGYIGGSIRLLLVGSLPAVRKGLEMRLALEDDLEVVGETGDTKDAIPLARVLRPEVILVDIDMPVGTDTILLTERLRSAAPWSAVVVLSLRDDAVTRERVRTAGAAAFVAKHRTEETLLATIRETAYAKQRRHGRFSASTEEGHGNDTCGSRGA
jgi:CheY-like chemotaxis protein